MHKPSRKGKRNPTLRLKACGRIDVVMQAAVQAAVAEWKPTREDLEWLNAVQWEREDGKWEQHDMGAPGDDEDVEMADEREAAAPHDDERKEHAAMAVGGVAVEQQQRCPACGKMRAARDLGYHLQAHLRPRDRHRLCEGKRRWRWMRSLLLLTYRRSGSV